MLSKRARKGYPRSTGALCVGRRRLLTWAGAGIVATGALATVGAGYATGIEPRWLDLTQVSVTIPGLPDALCGLCVAHLSDIHLYPYTDLAFVARAVDMTRRQRPDLVAVTGDFVLDTAEAIADLAPLLATLNPRLGIYAVLGNHEMWLDPDRVMRGLAKESIPTLVNEGVALEIDGATLFVAGLDDGWSGHPSLDDALARRPREATTILLAHEPDLADDTVLDPRVHVQLSGHSHGGQVRLPGIGALVLPFLAEKYDQGLYRLPRRTGEPPLWLYTNRGIGVNNPPIRIGCRPEVTILTLAPGDDGGRTRGR